VEKAKKTNIERYGYECAMKDPEIAREVTKKGYETKIKNGQIKVVKGKPLSEWHKVSNYSMTHFRNLERNHGLEFAISKTPQQTDLEYIMSNSLQSLGVEYEDQFRSGSYIADFVLTEHNIIIEC